jgi:hypothetical protein
MCIADVTQPALSQGTHNFQPEFQGMVNIPLLTSRYLQQYAQSLRAIAAIRVIVMVHTHTHSRLAVTRRCICRRASSSHTTSFSTGKGIIIFIAQDRLTCPASRRYAPLHAGDLRTSSSSFDLAGRDILHQCMRILSSCPRFLP